MAGEGEGTGEGTGQGTGAGTGQAPAWLAQLPADLKANEVFTKYPTLGDFGKSHLEVMGKIKELDGMTAKVGELEGQLKNAIPRLPENPSKEQVETYLTAIGRPGKPEEYEFPKGEGIEHDENMVKWFRNVAFETGLTKDQAKAIGGQWDQFIQGMVKAEEEATQREIEERNKVFRAQFKSDEEHNATLQTVGRFWKKVVGNFSQSDEDLDLNKYMLREGIGKEPTFLKFLIHLAKQTGEDFSPRSSGSASPTTRPGMIYDKTPQHQKR